MYSLFTIALSGGALDPHPFHQFKYVTGVGPVRSFSSVGDCKEDIDRDKYRRNLEVGNRSHDYRDGYPVHDFLLPE